MMANRRRAQFLALMRLHQREVARRRRAEAEIARLGKLLDFAVGLTLRDRPAASAVREELAAGAFPRGGDRFSLRPAEEE